MKQEVQFKETDDFFGIALVDSDSYLLEKTIEPEEKSVVVGLTTDGEVRIKEINFPKTLFSKEDVERTAQSIKNRFEQEGCRSCIAMAEADKTKKTFILPTPRQLVAAVGDWFAQFETED